MGSRAEKCHDLALRQYPVVTLFWMCEGSRKRRMIGDEGWCEAKMRRAERRRGTLSMKGKYSRTKCCLNPGEKIAEITVLDGQVGHSVGSRRCCPVLFLHLFLPSSLGQQTDAYLAVCLTNLKIFGCILILQTGM